MVIIHASVGKDQDIGNSFPACRICIAAVSGKDKEIVAKYDERGDKAVGNIERFAFYEEAKTAYCIISTSEKALYANIMLQKGVVINN